MAMFLLTLGLAASVELNPITRVAELLEDLSSKVTADAKKEQDLYDGFKCWCMKVINGKSASIEANEQRIAELNAYIDDLSSGRVELTSERGTLETEIADLEKAIAEETAMRKKQKEDFDAAKEELDKAIAALEDAVDVMSNGTAGSNRSTELVSLKARLTKATKIGSGFLAKRDVSELLKALQPDVPDVDYNKLNRDADFKMKYEHRSGEIQDILAEMLSTFKDNRDEAVNAEEKAKTDSAALLAAKQTQLDDSKQAGLDQKVEMGARAASKEESQTEVDNLTGQNERDKGFIADAKSTCATKATEWEERKRVRAEEKAAIQQTIATLRSDDARDLFKKSFSSQGKTLLIQTSAVVRKVMHPRVQKGVAMLEAAAIKAGDLRVLTLAQKIRDHHQQPTEADPFVEVTKAVDATIDELKQEEADDLKEKEICDKERHEKTQEVQMKSKAIDSNTARIARFNSYIQEAEKRVEEIKVNIKDLEDQKEDAKIQRDKEHAEFEIALEDDTKAVEVVGNAIKVLEDFYARENLQMGLFVQVSASTEVAASEEAPGEAPTPPPTTFDGPYKGAAGETGGVVGLMEMIKADIGKDIQKADKAEADALTAYNKLVADIDADILSLQTTKGGLEDAIADDTTSREEQKENRGTNQESMGATLTSLKAIAKSCDWITANIEPRMVERQEEMDNLHKAKGVFTGAEFAEPSAEE
jgi:chromosome segregation ATPase